MQDTAQTTKKRGGARCSSRQRRTPRGRKGNDRRAKLGEGGRRASQEGAGDLVPTQHPSPTACLYQKFIVQPRGLEVRGNPGKLEKQEKSLKEEIISEYMFQG